MVELSIRPFISPYEFVCCFNQLFRPKTGNHQYLPIDQPSGADSSPIEQGLQRPSTAAVRRLARRDQISLLVGPHSAVSLPVLAHYLQGDF